MKVEAQVRSIEYFYVTVDVPDNADYFEQKEAVLAAYRERIMDPDDHEVEVGDIDPVKDGDE